MPVRLRDLRGTSDADVLRDLYDDILVPYFAPGELVAHDELHAALGSDASDTDIVVALDDDGTVIGGAVGDWDADSRVYLLSYLAVRSAERSKGTGALLLERVHSFREVRDAVIMVGEVDDPRHHPVSDYGDPEARLRFYDRNGASLLRMSYTQPEVNQGFGRRQGMLLISFAVGSAIRAGDGVRADVIRRFLANYLLMAEDVPRDRVEAEVIALVPALAGADAVPIIPIARYRDV